MSNKNLSNTISDHGGPSGGSGGPGPFLAKVVSNLDPTYMGVLEVELLKPVGNSSSKGETHRVKYMSPFYGVTNVEHTGNGNNYDETQQSYGMWFIPPDTGCTVVVIFIEGDPKRGFWIGCVMSENMNFMVPGYAATSKFPKGSDSDRKPVGEYNKKAVKNVPKPSEEEKPIHTHLEKVFNEQGLLKDDVRGTTSSSSRREVPSAVFGISTPGPLDKASRTMQTGAKDHQAAVPVSRLGGSSFVMDDGDDKFLRKKFAYEDKPDYADVESGDKGGNKKIPHNELLRLRTRTGHQILLHNSEDLIYIGNARGTSWIEMTSDGKIDIYAKDSVSIHTEQDFNFTAGREINMTALGGDINFNASGSFNMTVDKNVDMRIGNTQSVFVGADNNLLVVGDSKLTANGSTHIKSGSGHIETAARIDMNGPAATAASAAKPTRKIVRVPTHEPYKEHENLDPISVKPDKTKAVEAPLKPADKKYFQKPTTPRDTFKVVPPPAPKGKK
jgi:hypothetical protein